MDKPVAEADDLVVKSRHDDPTAGLRINTRERGFPAIKHFGSNYEMRDKDMRTMNCYNLLI